jgi:hypothetical protein
MSRLILIAGLVMSLCVSLVADTLVLRNGTRVEGQLVAVRDNVIEFEERRGFGTGRRVRFDRAEVVRIEFDTPRGDSGSPGGRPFGMRERTAIVNANTPWTDTSVDVRAGQTIYFEARGEIRWGRDRRDGPAGERSSPRNPNRPLPNRPAAALIGKIGSGSTAYFLVGNEQGPIRVRDTGRLYLGINDDVFNDNSGSFRVVVYH